MATDPEDLTTFEKVKTRLSIPAGTLDFDALLQELVTGTSWEVQNRMGRFLNAKAYTDVYYSGDGGLDLVLANGPLALSPAPVVNHVAYGDDGAGARTETDTLVPASNYLLRGIDADAPTRRGVLHRIAGNWIVGPRNYKVTSTLGFATLPPSVEFDATALVAAAFVTREAAGLRGKTAGKVDLELLSPAQLDEAIQRVADKWRVDWGLG